MSPNLGPIHLWLPLLLAAAGALGAAFVLARRRGAQAERSPGAWLAQALPTALLLGLGVEAGAQALALALSAATGPLLSTLWRPELVAVACLAAALAFFEQDPVGRRWQLLGVGVAGLVPAVLGEGLARMNLGFAERPEPVMLGLVAASLGVAILSPGRRATLIRRARRTALDATGDGILVVDTGGRVLDANPAAREALALSASDARETGHGAGGASLAPEGLRKILDDPECRHVRFRTGSDRFFEAWIAQPEQAGSLEGVRAVVIRDVTGRRRDEHRLFRLAHYDSLTGLANRRLFVEHLDKAVRTARSREQLLALLYIDLDHFKEINDTLGHGAGDELLRVIAQRFRQHLRIEDVISVAERGGPAPGVSRLGGDEFAIVIPHIAGSDDASLVAARILRLIGDPVQLGEKSVTGAGSVGIALFPKDGEDVETLVKHADAALYAAKRLGRNRFEFYQPSMATEADRTRMIEQELRLAIERGELRLHYQPKVDIETGTVAGFEALARWTSSELGAVPPKEFIPVAESRGLIGSIGSWCIQEACHQIGAWVAAGWDPVPVSVNVSSAQFGETNLQEIVTAALREAGVAPNLLELELTESLLLQDDDRTALTLRDLRSIGVAVALDDFGTGYSALTYLSRIPLDTLKMDRGFVRDIETDASAAGIAAAVVSMAHSLKLSVVAEGVDSEEQIPHLRQMGCDMIQGFVYAPALPPDEVGRFLARQGEPRPVVPQHKKAIEDAPPGRPTQGAADAQPALVEALPDAADEQALAEARHALLLDDEAGTLASVALRLTRLGVDLHYVKFVEEAHLLLNQERGRIRLLITPPTVDIGDASDLLYQLATDLGRVPAAFLVVGEEPDEDTRARIRSAGATSVLWAPYEDSELRFVVNDAMALPQEIAGRRESRVPVNRMAWVRAGSRREAGVLSSLSARGAFVEMSEPLAVGTSVRLEFDLPAGRMRLFGRVAYAHADDPERPDIEPGGIGVVFDKLEAETELALREVVEELAIRFRP